jgi:CheY-like chemotaxis protein
MPDLAQILIVDDNPNDVYLLHKALRKCGIQTVASLASGEEAAKFMAGLSPYENRLMPDLIFLDFKMTGVDAPELIRWLQRDPFSCQIPIVVLSGTMSPDQQKSAIEVGARAVFEKPNEFGELVSIVEKVIADFLPH